MQSPVTPLSFLSFSFGLLFSCLLLLGCVPAGKAADNKALEILPAAGGFGIRLSSRENPQLSAFVQPKPLAISVVDADGKMVWLTGSYDKADKTKQGFSCAGALTTAHGTVFHVADTYQVEPSSGTVVLARTVTITSPSPEDKGFNSQFSLEPEAPTTLADSDCFLPGVWYKQNAHVPLRALASQMTDQFYYIREDRLPLPLVSLRNRRTGATLTLMHLGGKPTTFTGENRQARIIDDRMQFGSLGLINTDRPSPVFLFPGTEGERTSLGGSSTEKGRWAYRCHPVEVGVPHAYTLRIELRRTEDFPDAVRQAWRAAYSEAAPPTLNVTLDKVYQESIRLLSRYCQPVHGVPDIPFAARVPSGVISDTSSEMGFVGDALPVAALLLRDGLERGDPDQTARASAVVDFWAKNAGTKSGLPNTWYDIHGDGSVTWRSDQGYLRIASDGMEGMLRAWSTARAHGQDRPEWLAFCRRYGDWLVSAQAADGSYARRYTFDGAVVQPAKDTTDQVIPFLVDLYTVTGDLHYKAAALRAGEFCWTTVHLPYAYVGGTPDNPNVLDKEGGMEALSAFLALHDLTGEPRWLTAAAQAADYCETWVYCWNIPVPPDDRAAQFPKNRTTYGLSLIATGHSGCDNFMAAAPFLFYRLSLLTGDTHFRSVAQMLLHDTKQMLDWDGTLGYAYPGLLSEALSLSPTRGHGVSFWLPWLSVTVLEPMVDLRQTFGAFDIDAIERLSRAERLRRLTDYRRTRGLSVLSR